MKVLFDECVPSRLRRLLPNHQISTAAEASFIGVKNGELLKRASDIFEVLITTDKNLSFQQNPVELPIPVIVLHAVSNRLQDLEPLAPELFVLLSRPLQKQIYHLGA